MKSHLCHICGVPTDAEVPSIWTKVAAENIYIDGLALLDRFLSQSMDSFQRVYGGHMCLLHVSLTL